MIISSLPRLPRLRLHPTDDSIIPRDLHGLCTRLSDQFEPRAGAWAVCAPQTKLRSAAPEPRSSTQPQPSGDFAGCRLCRQFPTDLGSPAMSGRRGTGFQLFWHIITCCSSFFYPLLGFDDRHPLVRWVAHGSVDGSSRSSWCMYMHATGWCGSSRVTPR